MSKITNEQIIESYRRTRSYQATAKELGLRSRQAVHYRIMSLKAQGVELLPAIPREKYLKRKSITER